jgi:mono/diheme cytochrome c family protein
LRPLGAWFSASRAVRPGRRTAAPNDVQQGHRLARLVCAACHVAAPDQQFEPILRPPAPSFESIAQRSPQGMPNPQLLDDQVKQLAAYLLSLPKHS